MLRRQKIVFGTALVALFGVATLLAASVWLLWRESIASEEAYAGGLAATLGDRTEQIFQDTRRMLAGFDRLSAARCSPEHLQVLQEAAISRPYVRAIGYWQAAQRQCGVGFLPPDGLKPSRADRIYPSGVIAWWPSDQTSVGGVELFLMRFGDHDVAIDPRQLLDLGPMAHRRAGLWVEGLRMAAIPSDAKLPSPSQVPVGVTVDGAAGQVLSHYRQDDVLPIDIVAVEPLDSFWRRHAQTLALGAGIGLLLVVAWIWLILRFSRRQLSLLTELREAVAAGRIEVRYQPVIELATGRCVGAEALARWQRDNGEAMSPDIFIPLAEAAGLVQEITLSVLATALRELGPVLREQVGLSLNLNLAPDDLKTDRVALELVRQLALAGLSPSSIKLEITERALINSETSRALIRDFRQRGHQVAVDDFGTGYSSLSYLQTFELDVLKIDKSFVEAIGTEAATSQVIVHVIEMSKSLGLATVAEGVESPEQVVWLLAHGVAFGQGYIFSVPLTAGEFIEFYRSNRKMRG